MTNRFKLQLGDITAMSVGAVVNSTDNTLLSGGPVHVAVHRAAGPGLARGVRGRWATARWARRASPAGTAAAPYVLHTVAPIWVGGTAGEQEALASCYRNCLRLAEARGIESVAFPSLGSGPQPQIPLDQAAPVAIRTILEFLEPTSCPGR